MKHIDHAVAAYLTHNKHPETNQTVRIISGSDGSIELSIGGIDLGKSPCAIHIASGPTIVPGLAKFKNADAFRHFIEHALLAISGNERLLKTIKEQRKGKK